MESFKQTQYIIKDHVDLHFCRTLAFVLHSGCRLGDPFLDVNSLTRDAYVSANLAIIGSDGSVPARRQAIIWTSAGISSIGPLGTNFIAILI